MDVPVRFCQTPAGVRIAYQIMGDGPAIVWPAWFYTHLELLWENPRLTHFFGTLAERFSVVLYDKPGCGLSDRDAPAFTLAAQVEALAAVVAAVDRPRFALFGFSQGGPAAIAYAAQHPDQIARLLLYSTRGHTAPPDDPATAAAVWDAAKTLIRAHWGFGSSVLIQLSIPDADPALIAWEARLMQAAVDPEVAIRMLEQFLSFDVSSLLAQVQAPTLVLHRRGDQAQPFAGGRELAAGIPGARFVPMDGAWHALYERAEQDVLRHVLAHLDDGDTTDGEPGTGGEPDSLLPHPATASAERARTPAYPDGLTAREVDVLRLIAAGQSTREIAAFLVIAEGTVGRHVTNLYGKIGARGRADATAYAFRRALVPQRSA